MITYSAELDCKSCTATLAFRLPNGKLCRSFMRSSHSEDPSPQKVYAVELYERIYKAIPISKIDG